MVMSRDELLQLDEAELLKLCRVDTFRGVGPGGQKRNKTESAVRVTHLASGLFGMDDTSRSQHINRGNAVTKLRLEVALHLREIPRRWEGEIPSVRHFNYVRWLGVALDALLMAEYKISDAAAFLGISTNRFNHALSDCPAAWQFVNTERRKLGLPALRA